MDCASAARASKSSKRAARDSRPNMQRTENQEMGRINLLFAPRSACVIMSSHESPLRERSTRYSAARRRAGPLPLATQHQSPLLRLSGAGPHLGAHCRIQISASSYTGSNWVYAHTFSESGSSTSATVHCARHHTGYSSKRRGALPSTLRRICSAIIGVEKRVLERSAPLYQKRSSAGHPQR